MSDILRCPYCGGILEQSSIFNLNSYACTDLACKGYFMTATKDMWQELIRTRKALDVAVDALNVISQITNQIDVCDAANDALNTITSLKQKDK